MLSPILSSAHTAQLSHTLKHSCTTDDNKENVKHFEPVLMTASTAFSPVGRGKPRQDVRDVAKVTHFARDRDALARTLKLLLDCIKANPSVTSIEDLTEETVVQSLEQSESPHVLFYEDECK